MSRLISILCLLLIVGGVFYAWSSGLLMQVLDPTVRVAIVEKQLSRNQAVSQVNYKLADVAISKIKPGHIVFPAGATKEDAFTVFRGYVMSGSVEKGHIFMNSDLTTVSDTFVLQAMEDIIEGEHLERSNISVIREYGGIRDGAVVFNNQDTAMNNYLVDERLTASRTIDAGNIITMDDVSGGMGSVYVISSVGDHSVGDVITIEDISIEPRSANQLPRGSISFPSKAAGEIYVTTSGGMVLSKSVKDGEVYVVSSVTQTNGSAFHDGDLPTTLDEYLEFKAKFPDTSIFVDDKILVGSEPAEGDFVDLWAETSSTSGPFGVIKLKRISKNSTVARVVDHVETVDDFYEDYFYWANIGREAFDAIKTARAENRVVFMVNQSSAISDFLGNGAVCREDVCSVSKTTSSDLAAVRSAIGFDGLSDENIEVADEDKSDPLTVLDGVDADLEERLIARGFKTFEDISSWDDASIRVTAFNLEITQNLAVYIREQATNIIGVPAASRFDLGLTSSDIAN